MNSRHQNNPLRSHDQTERSGEQGRSDQPARGHLSTFSDFVVQALRDGRFHSRPREPQHYVLTCKHIHRRSGASEYNPISYSTMFGEEDVAPGSTGEGERGSEDSSREVGEGERGAKARSLSESQTELQAWKDFHADGPGPWTEYEFQAYLKYPSSRRAPSPQTNYDESVASQWEGGENIELL
ncbi:hypothetical protein KCV07_g3345, partial [Aureobasidium melanogenum]